MNRLESFLEGLLYLSSRQWTVILTVLVCLNLLVFGVSGWLLYTYVLSVPSGDQTVAQATVVLTLRPIKPSDEEPVRRFVDELGREKLDRRNRVMRSYLPLADIKGFCSVDNDTHVTLLALIRVGTQEKVIGCAVHGTGGEVVGGDMVESVEHGSEPAGCRFRKAGKNTRSGCPKTAGCFLHYCKITGG